jgi:hypothetical protein
VGPTSFSFLLSTAKKVKRKTLIFLCFLWYPCTLPLLFMLHLPHLYFLHLSHFLPLHPPSLTGCNISMSILLFRFTPPDLKATHFVYSKWFYFKFLIKFILLLSLH